MAYLVLSNKMVFEGKRFGAPGDSVGELVFTTGMTGYIETLTDPSYAGQIVMQTFPLIGNYGIIEEDFEGVPLVKGYVVSEACSFPSNFRSEYTLDEFLKKRGICALQGVDTREITRIIREEGVMNAKICDEIPEDFSEIENYAVKDVVKTASRKEIKKFPASVSSSASASSSESASDSASDSDGTRKKGYSVALIDYGAKKNIIRSLNERGCDVTVFPCSSSAEEILKTDPDGIMLSNGPGDPAENIYEIEQIKKLIGKKPIFGICLGHQLSALAMGGKTAKLKYGHRGANQPVRLSGSHKTYITSQNHGYAVLSESIKGKGKILFENANDRSCEGIIYEKENCFTVQFHPEASAGPRDTSFLFDKFIDMMGGKSDAER